MEAKLESVTAELLATKVKLTKTEAELDRKNQIIDALQKRLFGSSSERLDPDQLQLAFDEIVLGKPAAPLEPGDETSAPEEPEEKSAKRNRSRKKDLFPENLKIVIDRILIPDEVAADPDNWKKIGEEHHDELAAIKPELYWNRTTRHKYVHRSERGRPPIIMPAPEPSIPGTMCAPELAAKIIVDKFCDHLPFYRQSERFKRDCDAIIGRSTLCDWTHAVATHLRPIGEAIRTELLAADVIQIDETPIKYLSPGYGKTRMGFLWVGHDPLADQVYYDWQKGRAEKNLLDMLGYDPETGTILFAGTIQCDGYTVYETLAERYPEIIMLAACLAHIRRKFIDAGEQDTKVILTILKKIQELYRIEWSLRQLKQSKAPPDDCSACRLLVRKGHSRPVVEEIKEILDKEKDKHLPKSKLGEAIRYARNQWEQFERYLEDENIEIDNNLVENAIRPTKLGAKNWMFFGSAEAGENNALLYTLIENCKRKGLNPGDYLIEVLRKLPTDPTPEQAAELTPARIAAARAAAEQNSTEIEDASAA